MTEPQKAITPEQMIDWLDHYVNYHGKILDSDYVDDSTIEVSKLEAIRDFIKAHSEPIKTTEITMTKEQVIKAMVDRFLCWKLPADFHPDCGINFDANAANKLDPRNGKYEPVGTNLFTAEQAKKMVEFLLEQPTTKE